MILAAGVVAVALVGVLLGVLIVRVAVALWLEPPRVSNTWRADHLRDWRNDDGRP